MGWFASKILRWVGMEAGSTKAGLELASTGVDLWCQGLKEQIWILGLWVMDLLGSTVGEGGLATESAGMGLEPGSMGVGVVLC